MKRLLFVFNPYAGKTKIKSKLSWILDFFIKQGFNVEVYVTQDTGDTAWEISRRAWDMDLVVVSGGDGTMNAAVSGLMQVPAERRPPLDITCRHDQ